MKDIEHLFIVGAHRSGKTLLSRLLDGHPDCLCIEGETLIFHKFEQIVRFDEIEQQFLHLVGRPYDFTQGRTLPPETHIDRDHNWQKMTFWRALEAIGDAAAVEKRLKAAIRTMNPSTIYREASYLYAELCGAGDGWRYLVDDTPHNEWFGERILADFPTARFIHVIRDPFDALGARLGTRASEADDIELVRLAMLWRTSFHKGARLSARFPSRYILVRFEDIVAEPVHMMGRLANFLAIESTPSLIAPTLNPGRNAFDESSSRLVDPAESVLHQEILIADVAKDFGPDRMNLLASFWRRDCEKLGFVKYAAFLDVARTRRILIRAPLRQLIAHLKRDLQTFRLPDRLLVH